MTVSLEQLQTYLTEAMAARHALATGETVVEFWRDGRRMVFTKATLSELNKYIDSLKQEIAAAEAADAGRARRRPIRLGWMN